MPPPMSALLLVSLLLLVCIDSARTLLKHLAILHPSIMVLLGQRRKHCDHKIASIGAMVSKNYSRLISSSIDWFLTCKDHIYSLVACFGPSRINVDRTRFQLHPQSG